MFVRSNQLLGYGLVVGLDGTGDSATQTRFTAQSLKAMLAQLRTLSTPVIGRIENDSILLDCRSLEDDQPALTVLSELIP